MEEQWHEVLIEHDEGDVSFAAAAPLLVEALTLVAACRTLQQSVRSASWDAALVHSGIPSRPSHRMRESSAPLRHTFNAQLAAVYHSFSQLTTDVHVDRHSPFHANGSKHRRSPLGYKDGLVGPSNLHMNTFLRSQPVFDYATFRQQFERLCQVASNGLLFTACEPRIKVLQSRYRLYRVFNGPREDHFHPTLGGGDFARAPKMDVRRVNSCMSVNTLIAFMRQTLSDSPGLLLDTHSLGPRRLKTPKVDNDLRLVHHASKKESNDRSHVQLGDAGNNDVDSDDEEEDNNESDNDADAIGADNTSGATRSSKSKSKSKGKGRVSLQSLADAFFGPNQPQEERYFTADGLCLSPNYTTTTERFLDLFDKRGPSRPSLVNVIPLLRHFLDEYSGNNGELLARLVMPMLSRVSSSEVDVIELEFNVNGRLAGEIPYIAMWCVRSGLFSDAPRVQLALRIVQTSLSGMDEDAPCTAKSLEDVLRNVFDPIWLALLQPGEHPDVERFLGSLVSVSIAVNFSAEVQEMPKKSDPSVFSAENGVAAPDVFFMYHIWRNVQLLNCMIAAHLHFETYQSQSSEEFTKDVANAMNTRIPEMDTEESFFLPIQSLFRRHGPVMRRPLRIRLHPSSNSRNSFLESVMGLLIADDVVNPVELFTWSPLAYLYFLTQRRVVLTPSHHRSNSSLDGAQREAVPFVVETGLNGCIATLDPLLYHTSDNALCEELNGLLKSHHLAAADVTELCLHSAEAANWPCKESQWVLCGPWENVRALHNIFTRTQVNPLRLNFRESCLAHEIDLLCRKGPMNGRGFSLSPVPGGPFSRLLTLPEQRVALRCFFDIPSVTETSDSSFVGDGKRCDFVDKQIHFPRILISGPDYGERSEAARWVAKAVQKRHDYTSFNVHYELPEPSNFMQSMQKGVNHTEVSRDTSNEVGTPPSSLLPPSLAHDQQVVAPSHFTFSLGVGEVVLPNDATSATRQYFRPLPTWDAFQRDARWLRGISGNRAVQLFTQKRLGMLECKFNLHAALTNDDQESLMSSRTESSLREKGDLYKCVKVDVHCHMAAGMTARELLTFIKEKVTKHKDDIVDVDKSTGESITLSSMFSELMTMHHGSLDVEKLTVAALEVKAKKSTFNRFDEFNSRYNPLGISSLRHLFLKTDNFMNGRYFAELIRETLHRQESEGTTFSEYRLSIYGRDLSEWDHLARWFVLHGMSHRTNRWMVQVPRLYGIYRRNAIVASFGEMMRNIFLPLWEASVNPQKHPFMSFFLGHVSGFDSVDNESEREPDALIDTLPDAWTMKENPPFTYWTYYMWANITALNRYRAAKGLSTFAFRPHAGESGDPDHLADVFLVADGINHGINLKERPLLQYLYYLVQIPLGMTPLSNNALFCKYEKNPFPIFFRRGLNVTLSTDGALTFHHTEQPLIEEYSTAVNFWQLSPVDVSEIARNSVLMSGFPSYRKREWLGDLFSLQSVAGNDVRLSNLPQTRCTFRYELYLEELHYLQARASLEVPVRSALSPEMEDIYLMDAVGLTRKEIIEKRFQGETVRITPKKNKIRNKKSSLGNGVRIGNSKL